MSNNQYTVRGLEPRNLAGHSWRIGSAGYWECNEALNQLAQLVSRVTINQWAMEQNLEQWKNQTQNNFHIVTQNQVIGNNKIEALKAQNLEVAQQLAEQFYAPVKNQLNQMTVSIVNLSKAVEQLSDVVTQLAGSTEGKEPKNSRGDKQHETDCGKGNSQNTESS